MNALSLENAVLRKRAKYYFLKSYFQKARGRGQNRANRRDRNRRRNRQNDEVPRQEIPFRPTEQQMADLGWTLERPDCPFNHETKIVRGERRGMLERKYIHISITVDTNGPVMSVSR